MKRVLVLAAVGEAATGAALLIVPSLVGRLLLGAELTGIAMTVARVTGIALIALGSPAGLAAADRHADLQCACHAYLAYLGTHGGGSDRCCGRRSSLHAILTALLTWTATSDKETKTRFGRRGAGATHSDRGTDQLP